MKSANKPAAPNAGIASQLTVGHHWPGVGEPGRWAFNTSRTMRFALSYMSNVCLIGTLLAVGTGCMTSKQTGPEGGSKLFLERTDYDRRIEQAVGDVLDGHRFFIPWLVLQGTESSLWFVGERFHSLTDFERVFVHITRTNEVHVEIRHYQIVLSDWASGGGHFLAEAEEIRRNIQGRLSEDSRNVKQ